jgi:hypothetical protein
VPLMARLTPATANWSYVLGRVSQGAKGLNVAPIATRVCGHKTRVTGPWLNRPCGCKSAWKDGTHRI